MTAEAPSVVTIDPSARTSTVAMSGEIDIAVAEFLQTAVDEAVADRPDTVIVDFAGVTFMDSTGIRFLIGFKNRCDAIGATWSLTNVPPSIERLIDLSGLTDFLSGT